MSVETTRKFIPKLLKRRGAQISVASSPDQTLLAAEAAYIRRRRGSDDVDPVDDLRALALSGGGIRSATFGLGVMQALARQQVLEKMDYLSTVSGGGYIGASLTWLLQRKNRQQIEPEAGVEQHNFPYGTDMPDTHGVVSDSDDQRALLDYLSSHGNYLTPGAGITGVSFLGVILRSILLNLLVWLPLLAAGFLLFESKSFGVGLAGLFRGAIYAAGLGVLLFVLTSCAYSLSSWLKRKSDAARRYYARRQFEIFVGKLLLFIVVSGALGSLGYIGPWLDSQALKADTSVAALLIGAGSGVWTWVSKRRLPIDVIAPVAALIFLYGLLLGALSIADQLQHQWPHLHVYFIAAMAVFSAIMGWCVNLNYVAVHRYYRDRLMEAFMPEPQQALDNQTTASLNADPARLHDMCDPDDPRGPYHLINTHIVLVNSQQRKYRERGGDSFLLSPFYCGSSATGWYATRDFMGGGMTLATAMAISGAAANPNAGPGGTGVTRNVFVAFLMAFLNLRLGYWAPNPSYTKRASHLPNHFEPGWYEVQNFISEAGHTEEKAYIQLSDGGHFENLGLYELLRRQVRTIICCDAAEDAGFSFFDLQTAMRYARQDFGVHIDFGDELQQLLPTQDAAFPMHSRCAARGYAVADIHYADGSSGQLIYLKTTVIPELGFETQAYKGAHPDFPDQTTVDQFFDHAQFAAYRELGYNIAQQALADPRVRAALRG